jgi:outer membrane receptor protein involved in Fe transport
MERKLQKKSIWNLFELQFMKSTKKSEQKTYRQILSLALACGSMASGTVLGQTNTTPAATNVLDTVTVEGQLNQARSSINTAIGATQYTIDSEAILNEAQGDNTGFNELLLRAPGVAEDSLGQVHVRGEHANLQYRINDVLLPEGITGFGQELDPRFVKSMQLINGSLPAEYGFRTAGIVDIQTKSGAALNGGSLELFGGSYDTIRPSFEFGTSSGKSSFFVDGSYDHNALGIENPTPNSTAIHDYTDQYKTFMYYSYIMDPTSRIVALGSFSYSQFEIPNIPTQTPTPQPGGAPWVGAANPSPLALNDNQNEMNDYGVLAYQKSSGDLNYQFSAYGRNSSAHYMPDNIPATLDYNAGVATDEDRILYSGGAQLDLSYNLGDNHTLRGGLQYLHEAVTANTSTTVFDVDGAGNATGGPFSINQDNSPHADFGGLYLQDEWRIVPQLTLNAGGRFDVYTSDSDAENQISPRANLVYKPIESTTLHAGYARYFTPPPLETVPSGNIAAFDGTSGASGVTGPYSTVRAERANYYDLGISQKVPAVPGLTLGVDGYYKTAQEQLDDGFFGQSLILSSFNYERGRVRGVEFTANYDHKGLSLYANVAYSVAQGEGASSAQELWGDDTVRNYVNSHWIYLDHDQRVTGSFGAAYTWNEPGRWSTRVLMDALYGSGLRQNGPGLIPGSTDAIPNGSSVGAYYTLNFGVAEKLRLSAKQFLVARLDIVNITDNIYPLRTGSGVGVNAAQYGERRGFFGSLSYLF